jgi:hypothetical protein
MVLESHGYGVKESRLWYWRVTVMVLKSDVDGVTGICSETVGCNTCPRLLSKASSNSKSNM